MKKSTKEQVSELEWVEIYSYIGAEGEIVFTRTKPADVECTTYRMLPGKIDEIIAQYQSCMPPLIIDEEFIKRKRL